VRPQARDPNDRVIKANDPRVDEYVAMKLKGPRGYQGFIETYAYGCEKWRDDVVLVKPQETIILKTLAETQE
jgi:hypothetical protein